jgi:predicted metal-dependent phosphoesterase TrpH
LIDLHTHTTASDGRSSPQALVARAAAAGVTVLSVTDHDTVGSCEAAAAAGREAAIELVPGIEITSIVDGRDVHVLGYFIDPRSEPLAAFLRQQRDNRIDRVRQMIARLGTLGMALDADAILEPALRDPSVAVGRPWIARSLVAAGHAATSSEAFERWLVHGRPAFVPRSGAGPAEVIGRIHDAGGLASLAHPILVRQDDWLPTFARQGLDALEAYHTDHDPAATRKYLDLASRLNLLVTGGSDYHGDESHGSPSPGSVSLPRDAFERLKARREQRS